ncbi:MAG: hypothetical protein M1828_002890 [Chrysothrix sp. TS-e1954]|nr:MAG: hypothetical protein M1828_002890 [Chrysothrix sp. TS-e1954]
MQTVTVAGHGLLRRTIAFGGAARAFCNSNHCTFLNSTAHHEKALPPRKPLDEGDITESFLRGSGPGGQKINKTSSAVQLHHAPSRVVVKCQQTRSRIQNRKIARRLLQDRLEELELGDASRTKVKEERQRKKKQSADKKKRRKYRELDSGKDSDGEGQAGEEVHLGGTANQMATSSTDSKA